MEDNEERPLLRSTSQEESIGCGNNWACDPRRPYHKYLILVILCLLTFGSYLVYDNPTALADHIIEDIDITNGQYGLFSSIYSWPNVILCFFGGILLDKVFGLPLGAIIFATIVLSGQVVFALGAFFKSYGCMVAGRFIFGLGGESLSVAQNAYTVNWFKGSTLSLVFGLQLSVSRVGSTVNMNIMSRLYDSIKASSPNKEGYVYLGGALLVASGFCVLSLLSAFALAYFHKRKQRILRLESGAAGDSISVKDILKFPATFWLLCAVCVTYYVAVFPFVSFAPLFIEQKWSMDTAEAATITGLIYLVSAVGSPLCGFIVDRTGRNVLWVMAGVFATLACHGLMAFTFTTPYVPFILFGISYSILASSLWPMVALIIPIENIGTAYGAMQAVQNLGLAVVPLAAGAIIDARGFLIVEFFFILCLCLALFFTALLYIVDASKSGILNASSAKRRNDAKRTEQTSN